MMFPAVSQIISKILNIKSRGNNRKKSFLNATKIKNRTDNSKKPLQHFVGWLENSDP